jgi:hypothetical protein
MSRYIYTSEEYYGSEGVLQCCQLWWNQYYKAGDAEDGDNVDGWGGRASSMVKIWYMAVGWRFYGALLLWWPRSLQNNYLVWRGGATNTWYNLVVRVGLTVPVLVKDLYAWLRILIDSRIIRMHNSSLIDSNLFLKVLISA